jgi:hypothetical protein
MVNWLAGYVAGIAVCRRTTSRRVEFVSINEPCSVSVSSRSNGRQEVQDKSPAVPETFLIDPELS